MLNAHLSLGMKNHLNLTCNRLLHVRLGRATCRRLFHQLCKVNGILHNSVIPQCRTQVIIKDAVVDVDVAADADVVATDHNTINIITNSR